MFVHGGIAKFMSLEASAHEIYGQLIALIILLHQHNSERSVRSEGVKEEIFLEI